MPKYRVLKRCFHSGSMHEVGDVFSSDKEYASGKLPKSIELVGKRDTGAAALTGTSSTGVEVEPHVRKPTAHVKVSKKKKR